jgi:hypothetical protein
MMMVMTTLNKLSKESVSSTPTCQQQVVCRGNPSHEHDEGEQLSMANASPIFPMMVVTLLSLTCSGVSSSPPWLSVSVRFPTWIRGRVGHGMKGALLYYNYCHRRGGLTCDLLVQRRRSMHLPSINAFVPRLGGEVVAGGGQLGEARQGEQWNKAGMVVDVLRLGGGHGGDMCCRVREGAN